MTPPSPNVNVKQRVRDFLLSSRLNAWKKKTTGRAGGGKVVQVFLVRGHTHYAMKASYSRRIVAL